MNLDHDGDDDDDDDTARIDIRDEQHQGYGDWFTQRKQV